MMRALLTAALALTLAACGADTTNYPSLARRPAERTAPSPAPTAPAPVASAPEAGLSARLAAMVEQAREADARFAARRESAERTVADGTGAAPGSEGWARANVALADLESARSETMVVLADLDQLFAAARIDGSDSAAIAAAREQVSGLIAEEDRVLARLRERLGG